jgi:peptide-methionine (S)-S-oxide reductase
MKAANLFAAVASLGVMAFTAGCRSSSSSATGSAATQEPKPAAIAETAPPPPQQAPPVAPENVATAIFAGGCFWCMEKPFDEVPGVVATTSGYTGGTKLNPTYQEVSAGGTGHAESMRVSYDSTRVTYQQLLDVYWKNIDPTTPNRQFCDAGTQYRSAIFYQGGEQHRLAEESKKKIQDSGRFKQPIVTEIVAATEFYPAEEYHQDFYKKDPVQYESYRLGCGRDKRLQELWGTAAKH